MTRPLVALAVALLAASCTADGTSTPPDPPTDRGGGETTLEESDIKFADATSLPMILDERDDALVPRGAFLAGLRLVNYRDRSIRITNMELRGDPGLTATYLGHSTCETGCPGSMAFDDPSAQRMLRESIDGLYPIDVEPESLVRTLVFKVELDGATGVSELVERCELYVRTAVLTLEDGSHVEVAHGSADHLVGVHLFRPLPAAASHCVSRDDGDGAQGSNQEGAQVEVGDSPDRSGLRRALGGPWW